jgi:predicted alpha/beta superfamily hydrolase
MRAFCAAVCGLVIVLTCHSTPAAQQQKVEQPPLPAVSLTSTQVRTVSSTVLSRDFQIYVSLPWSYRHTQKRYPTVYVLDADLGFGFVQTAYQASQNDQEVPEVILVGIAYGVDLSADFSTWANRRMEELTPSAAKDQPKSGEAARFSRFLREEVVPMIEKNYRTDTSDRTLLGASLGGLFTMYVMLQTPAAFHQYIARSPSLAWDNRMLFSVESAYAAKHRELPATLFTSIGTAEIETMTTTWREFVKTLTDRQYEGFRLVTTTIPDARHGSAISLALFPGLRSVLSGWPVDAEFLDRYVGRYVMPQNVTLTITREGQQLWADWNGQRRLRLLARAPAKFSFATGGSELIAGRPEFVPLLGLEYIDFRSSGRGPAERIAVYQNGKPITATRAK